ncbi:malto-oligosyltrehalose synthase [Actinacidiphila acididurans]|uniref:Malto-oligosyltrehalose synthase n=1 Tax=Actinacidiphila acididurans TaxID=2784346 RepID=A0ABS2TYJ6_9ACTN|nr:malto-oligosyltrehalose synthase [Actinacidiphila acididurans]MBM9507380.1 malto-oligosyltrehalose synthase [Actinacidiphila acididurans]
MTAHSASPAATYRIQVQPGFTFADAAAAVPYLARLGVSHLHLSPVLEAVPGSTHGYDVVDHSRVRAELGGEEGLRELSRTAAAHGLGLVLDVVPNHMAVPAPEHLNAALWSVLRDGPDSPFASWFDIDRSVADGKLLLPVLGDPLPDVLDELTVGPDKAAGGKVLRYYEHRFPLRPGTEDLPLPELIAAQWYRPAYWRAARTELNYRRFFTISDLIAVRVEDEAVFEATHGTVLRLLREGVVEGLRIDHPDGLADPAGYLRRLAAASGGRWTVVEKILQRDEELPQRWSCAGTTGYDALDRIDGLFTDPAGVAELVSAYQDFTGAPDDLGGAWEPTVRRAADRVAEHDLAAEVARLARAAHRAAAAVPDGPAYPLDELAGAFRALLVRVPVYRPYVPAGGPAGPGDTDLLERAAQEAGAGVEDAGAVDFVRDLALGRVPGADAADVTVRFAQVASALHAKSVEDAAFYRYVPLLSLCEVGRDPAHPATGPEEFHAYCAALSRRWPATGTALSTHDTKRSADLRLRLAVLSELPGAWRDFLAACLERATAAGLPPAPDRHSAYTVLQTAVGLGDPDPARLVPAALKAAREAGLRTTWTEQDQAYEKALADFTGAGPCDALAPGIEEFAARLRPYETANVLGAALLHLTMPGVPDLYQGTELPVRTLVDPDNRAPMGAPAGAQALPRLLAGEAPRSLAETKLRLTAVALRLRRDHPRWYGPGAAYRPLAAEGPAAGHCVAFVRGEGALTAVTRLSRRLAEAGGWRDSVLPLPPGHWRDRLGGGSYEGRVPLADLLGESPVALLTLEPAQE